MDAHPARTKKRTAPGFPEAVAIARESDYSQGGRTI